jgi:hypothetical protein
MDAQTVVTLVLGAAMFVVALVGLMVKLVQLGRK